jgi:cytidine deaminase
MYDLTEADIELVKQATEIIKKNYDGKRYFHTVGAALRCKSGKVYLGVNVYSVHGSCAEYTAIGSAITAGEREFDCVVAIGGDDCDKVYSPCGNCRQMLLTYMPEGFVIVDTEDGLKKVSVKSLIPFGYTVK